MGEIILSEKILLFYRMFDLKVAMMFDFDDVRFEGGDDVRF